REGVRQGDELMAPAVDRAEIALKRADHRFRYGATVTAQAGEVELMQQRGIECCRLFLLQPADDLSRRRLRIERGKLIGDRIQARECAAVVILIMTLDQPRRDP